MDEWMNGYEVDAREDQNGDWVRRFHSTGQDWTGVWMQEMYTNVRLYTKYL